MTRQKVLSALVLIPLIVVIVWFGDPAYSLLVAAFAALGALEFYGMRGLSWKHPLTLFGLISILLFVLVAHFEADSAAPLPYMVPLLTFVIVFSLISIIFHSPTQNASVNWAWTLTGIIYIGWMLSHFIPLREFEGGRDWVLFAIFATFAADTVAFLVGRAWGRHPLAFRISPGKTWEGAMGGLLGAITAAVVLAAILPGISIPCWHIILLGALVGVFAQLGDLAESVLKRSAGVKDAGRLIPGHGGLLDRLDSILLTVVVVYYYVFTYNALIGL